MIFSLYFFSFFTCFEGLRRLAQAIHAAIPSLTLRGQKLVFRQVSDTLRDLEESLAAGLVPPGDRWEALGKLPAPWGRLAFDSVRELRAAGGSLRPTLKRLRELAEGQSRLAAEARSKAAHALGQAGVCALLAPVLGAVLYEIAPGVDERPYAWGAGCAAAFLLSCCGTLWMLAQAEHARWAGLAVARRHWILAVQCAGERFLSIIRGGSPADLAWTQACGLLAQEAPELAARWGHSLWRSETAPAARIPRAEIPLVEAGEVLRKAVHASLMDGRPCAERVEAGLDAFREDVRVRVQTELTQLPNRTLKPLFVFVAPAILGLIAFSLYLCWLQASADL